MSITIRGSSSLLFASRGAGAAVLAGLAVFAASRPVAAEEPDGPTVTGEICMQKVFGAPVNSKNQVNCTANDISLAKTLSVSPASCTEGETFDLMATFAVNVTANSRFDAGIFFRVDGGLNARGDGPDAGGTCSLSALDPEMSDDPMILSLDKDSCGDFNAGSKTVTLMIPDVLCSDPDHDHYLNLPYCTSWHSNQATFCSIDDAKDDDQDLLFSEFEWDDASYFKPDTKSKCVCDDHYSVPVAVEAAKIEVVKSVAENDADLELTEPGGDVPFTVTVTNLSKFESVTIKELVDDVYGDLLDPNNDNQWLVDNGCLGMYDVVLEPAGDPNDSATCVFTGEVYGDAPYTHHDIVEVKAIQSGNDAEVSDADDANVHILNTASAPTVTKAVDDCQIVTMNVTYTVSVANPSTFEELALTGLTDDKFGDIMDSHEPYDAYGKVVSTTCGPHVIPKKVDGNDDNIYTCNFVGEIAKVACDLTHDNVVTAETDDDGNMTETPSNTATLKLQSTTL